MICFATGITLMLFFNLNAQGLGRYILSSAHRVAGSCLFIFPALALLRNRRDYRIHFYNIRQAWIWRTDDFKWLALFGPSTVSRKVNLPEQGKFNAAEKLNFMMVMCASPLLIASGVILWLPGTPFRTWLVHVSLALVAAPLMIGHIYMALANPSTRVGLSGMFTGYVDRLWAKHHYRLWYREHYEREERLNRQPRRD
jgi:formate dehydrogenase gamma subunit